MGVRVIVGIKSVKMEVEVFVGVFVNELVGVGEKVGV